MRSKTRTAVRNAAGNAILEPRLAFWLLVAVCLLAGRASAQRHSLGSSPPTAPPSRFAAAGAMGAGGSGVPNGIGGSGGSAGPVAPVSSGLGAIQFQTANSPVMAPQALTRQMESEDERTRAGALAALGVPSPYLQRGHAPFPHSVQLDLVQLGASNELDALLTVELDQHIVSAVLVPEGESWRRVATLLFATAFNKAVTTPSTFVRPLRSWLEPDRYRASYHAAVTDQAGDFVENEADLRIANGHAVLMLDFVSGARQCDAVGPARSSHGTCELIQRWLEPDPTDPTHHFTLITGTGHFSAHEADDPLSRSRNYRFTHLRSFACQPYVFSEASMHFQPTANSTPCGAHEVSGARAEHP